VASKNGGEQFSKKVLLFFEDKMDFFSFELIEDEDGEHPVYGVWMKDMYGYPSEYILLKRFEQTSTFNYLQERYQLWQMFGLTEHRFKSYIYDLVSASALYPDADVYINFGDNGSLCYYERQRDGSLEQIAVIDIKPTTELVFEYATGLYAAIDAYKKKFEKERLEREQRKSIMGKFNQHFTPEEQEIVISSYRNY